MIFAYLLPKHFYRQRLSKNGSQEDKQPIGVCESVNLLSLDDFLPLYLVISHPKCFPHKFIIYLV